MRQQQYGQILDSKYNKLLSSGNPTFTHTLKRNEIMSLMYSKGKPNRASKGGKSKKSHEKLSKTMGHKESAKMTLSSLMSRNAPGDKKYGQSPSYQIGSSMYKPKTVSTGDHSVERAKKIILQKAQKQSRNKNI